ncbi:TetR/AcrR family transcriptional regulator [Paenibacillus sp. DMB5]|uniref:TetR/AcrR family transcriptional regulator n=1 Tax=Paenibacillus sp. DMB5 TaxID=1780103 RepID=UPI0012FF9BAC|nr:TetR/AcrR family transcriptional regulator [Paenibacillus sp. DMB5]
MRKTRDTVLLASEELLAQIGYASFSLGQIAERLKISKGVVTYHFPQKDLIINEIVQHYFLDAAEYMEAHMVLDRSAPEALASYIKTNLNFVVNNPIRTLAISQIIGNHRDKEGRLVFADQDDQILQPLIEIFEYGQKEEKSFRAFQPELMAVLVRSAIDTLSGRIAKGGIPDINRTIEETVNSFILATRCDDNEEASK